MKKFTSLLLVILMVLCLVCGCTGDTDNTSSTDSVVSSTQSTESKTDGTSSKGTTSRLTDEQIKMTGYLGDWSEKLNTVNQASKGKFTFLVQTDTHHYDTTVHENGKNVAAFSNFVSLDFAAHLGDIIRGYSQDEIDNPENMLNCMNDMVSRYTTGAKCPVFMTVGNHDTNKMWCDKWADHTAQFTPELQKSVVYDVLKQHNGDKMNIDEDGSYYYIDFPEDKIRVVMLNTSNGIYDGTKYSNLFTISDKQAEWFKTEAINTEYSLIVMSHVPLNSQFTEEGSNSVQNSSLILNAVEEFISGGGDFIAYLCGHEHLQHEYFDENDRLHISFLNGGKNGEVVMINTADRIITTIGLGNAKDREYRY